MTTDELAKAMQRLLDIYKAGGSVMILDTTNAEVVMNVVPR